MATTTASLAADVPVRIHYRNGTHRDETHTSHDAWKLATTYNCTAYDARATDVWCESAIGAFPDLRSTPR